MEREVVLFSAMLVPYRSVGRRGHRLTLMLLLVGSAILSGGLAVLRVWPVLVIEVFCAGLAMTALRINMQQAASREELRVTELAVQIIRTAANGRATRSSLSTAWLSVQVLERGGTVPRLVLRNRHRAVEIACDLGEAEKRDLANALRAALQAMQQPVFDNPQLR